MPVQPSQRVCVKAVLSVSAMAKAIGMSRSQFYAYVRRGVFPQPLFCLTSKRPLYSVEMQEEIHQTRRTGQMPGGEYILFYERSHQAASINRRSSRDGGSNDLTSRLEALGLTTTPEQVQQAITTCFPNGTAGKTEADVLRAIYRHLRSGNVA